MGILPLFFLSSSITSFSHLAWIECLFYLKIQENFDCLIIKDRFWSVHIPFVVSYLHNSRLITFPLQSCLLVYFFCSTLLHSLLCDWLFHLSLHIAYTCCFLSFICFSFYVIIIIIIIIITPLRVFHADINWWFSTEVWVTASLFNVRINFLFIADFSVLILVVFLCCFFLSLHFGQISSLAFFRWFLPRPRIGMMSLVTISPVITAFHSCCLLHSYKTHHSYPRSR